MIPLKLDTQMMQTMALFEKITRAKLKDCFEDTHNKLTFVVRENEIKKVLGKTPKESITRLQQKFNRPIRVLEYTENVEQFIKNCVRPVRIEGIHTDGDTFILISPDHKSRGLLIGRNAQILRNNESIVKRYFNIKELKVQ